MPPWSRRSLGAGRSWKPWRSVRPGGNRTRQAWTGPLPGRSGGLRILGDSAKVTGNTGGTAMPWRRFGRKRSGCRTSRSWRRRKMPGGSRCWRRRRTAWHCWSGTAGPAGRSWRHTGSILLRRKAGRPSRRHRPGRPRALGTALPIFPREPL